MTNENTVKLLNDLLTKTCDAEQGYQHSAGKCDHYTGIRYFLESQSELRLSFARDIVKMISRFGAKPDRRACFTAKAQQAWAGLRALVGDQNSILAGCRRGEQAALEVYDGMIAKDDSPSIVRAMLVNQRAEICRSLAKIEANLSSSSVHTKHRGARRRAIFLDCVNA